jgi:hypothetical protein
MEQSKNGGSALILGFFIFLGLATLGYLLSNAAIRFKQYERSVTVKGLSEREVPADVVIWPIQFTVANNEITALYKAIETNSDLIRSFLIAEGMEEDDISFAIPAITDKSAQSFGNNAPPEFRYSAMQTVTLYSRKVDKVRSIMNRMAELGKQGIAFTGGGYQQQMEYIFTGLNGVKPQMIEEATTKAREVATKFADDSQSKLGKIKRASQGQFSIAARDNNNPHIKKIRVVSTVEYYLSD